MIVYRFAKKARAYDLTGEGAMITGGRWNSKGVRAVLAATSSQLAILNNVIHNDDLTGYMLAEIYIPDSLPITEIDKKILPDGWNNVSPISYSFTQSIGDEWLLSRASIALMVPDSIFTDEFNVLINPLHPDFYLVRIISVSEVFHPFLTGRHKMSYSSNFEFDVFISHASEDKDAIVLPLVKAINKIGLRCWFDKEKITWGESITKSINYGLDNSRYVLAILSANYLKKPWAMTELQAALNKQISSGKIIILPIIVGTPKDHEDIINAIPLLRDNLYITWKGNPSNIITILKKITLD